MIFNKRQEVYDFIRENPMAYHRMIKSIDLALFTEIKMAYVGTKNIGENFWLYCNNYSSPLTCKCGTKLLFENVISGYKSKECKPCYNISRALNSIIETKKREQEGILAPVCANTDCSLPVVLRSDGIWGVYCSKKCRGIFNSLLSRNKAKTTMLEHHGVEHALQSKTILDKMYASNLVKYGTENVAQLDSSKEQLVNTCMAKYGVSNPFSAIVNQQTHIEVLKQKYGNHIYNISQIPGVQEKKMKSGFLAKEYTLPSGKIIRIQGYENLFLDKALAYYDESIFDFDTIGIPYQFENKLHVYFPDFVIGSIVVETKSDYTFYDNFDKNIAKALGCVLLGKTFVFDITSGKLSNYLTIDENKIKLIGTLDDNSVAYVEYKKFDNYIVDIFVPEKNIAIHIRHSKFTDDVFLPKTHYTSMFAYFEKAGIQLITVFTGDINDIWLSSLQSKLTKNNDVVYARKTTLSTVNTGSMAFLNNHHVQGHAATSIKYGLYENNELVAIMCFSKFRKGIGKDRGAGAYELVRYATSKCVIGGASKLLKKFITDYEPTTIYSYSDNAISTGNMYKKLGFSMDSTLAADYKYIDPVSNTHYHRFKYRKGALGGMAIYDESLSERNIMKANGYRRIYDSGKKTWVLTL